MKLILAVGLILCSASLAMPSARASVDEGVQQFMFDRSEFQLHKNDAQPPKPHASRGKKGTTAPATTTPQGTASPTTTPSATTSTPAPTTH